MDEAVKEAKFIGRSVIQLGVVLTLFFFLAVWADWYTTYPWIDIPQHFLFGILSGITFYWFAYKLPRIVNLSGNKFFIALLVVSWAVFLGMLWEFLEFTRDFILIDYLRHNIRPAQLSNADTMGDLFFDLLGGLSLAIFMRLRYDKRKRQL